VLLVQHLAAQLWSGSHDNTGLAFDWELVELRITPHNTFFTFFLVHGMPPLVLGWWA
jgi:hypothetical protein